MTRSQLQGVLDRRWPCSLDDVRRLTRLGMGPCQGGFCTFRAAGAVADHAARVTSDPIAIGDMTEAAMAEFLRERQRGTQPIAHGRQLQEASGHRPQVCITLPILVGTDGHEKMSKSLGNYIGITESPNDMFGKVMSIPDDAIVPYFTLVTRLHPHEVGEIRAALDARMLHPLDATIAPC